MSQHHHSCGDAYTQVGLEDGTKVSSMRQLLWLGYSS